MSESPDDLCPRPPRLPPLVAAPHAPPIYNASVYQCVDTTQASGLLSGDIAGYVYSRDGHPNADMLAEACRALHAAERAAVTSSGMAALALAVLSQLRGGDHVLVGSQLYGRSLTLLTEEAARLGIYSSRVDACDLAATATAITPKTRLLVVETITNPVLRVPDLARLAELAAARGVRLLVDNTFAGPVVCRPMALGADLVMESVTKIISGHADVLLGLLCGCANVWERVTTALSSWGMIGSPMDCWLALRGLGTLALRTERSSANALRLAEWLAGRRDVAAVHYPGLARHPDHEIAARQFGERFGSVVTFTLPGDTLAAEAFIAAARRIPFCPSLGDISTTLSHPASTSHRTLTKAQRAELGITGGTIRLSVGIESAEYVQDAVAEGLAGIGMQA